jgi:hypothetical protein
MAVVLRHYFFLLTDFFFVPLAVLVLLVLRPPPLANGAAFLPPNRGLRLAIYLLALFLRFLAAMGFNVLR